MSALSSLTYSKSLPRQNYEDYDYYTCFREFRIPVYSSSYRSILHGQGQAHCSWE